MTVTDASSLSQPGGLELMTWSELDGLDAFVTTRAGGVSAGPYESLNLSLSVGDDPEAVLENRRRVAAAVGAGLEDFVFTRQVHGAGVRIVGPADRGAGTLAHDASVPEADVLVTADPSVVLAILTADCVPIVLHDPQARVLACVHAGWRGTVARACAAAIAAMGRLGAAPERIVAGIGPAIGADRYQVGQDVHQAVTAVFGPSTERIIRPDGTGRWLLDLPAANRLALRDAGVADGHMHTTQYVTGDGLFFSDRSARPCGRLALIARLRPGTPTTGGSTR
ncbi:MAG TPA: peptidoglycan editing factor PgeF [Trebonia sp.]|nr:peptidoglycan editing factor PgeF [Trebonia sp.]